MEGKPKCGGSTSDHGNLIDKKTVVACTEESNLVSFIIKICSKLVVAAAIWTFSSTGKEDTGRA